MGLHPASTRSTSTAAFSFPTQPSQAAFVLQLAPSSLAGARKHRPAFTRLCSACPAQNHLRAGRLLAGGGAGLGRRMGGMVRARLAWMPLPRVGAWLFLGGHMLCLEILMSTISLGRALAMAIPKTLAQSNSLGCSSSGM